MERTAIAMWDFSWLVRRFGDEAEYRDWRRVLDELAERGYDCVRIDAFPHLVAMGADGSSADRFTIHPQRPRFMWGNHRPVEVSPRDALPEFIDLAGQRDISVALSSWFLADDSDRRGQVATPEDYARIWTETLAFLEDQHESIAWVDLCNEFPLGQWAPVAWQRIFDARSEGDLRPALRRWTDAQRARVHTYFAAIDALRARWPNLRYTFSFQGLLSGGDQRHLDLDAFDVLDAHVWLSNDYRFCFRSGQLLALLETPLSGPVHRVLGPVAWRLWRKRWRDTLGQRMDAWIRCARRHDVPLLTTEGWASTNYVDAPRGTGTEWDWVKDVCAEAVHMAVDRGWTGLCTSNFCQPHFPGMWRDVGWHRRLTARIRRSRPDPGPVH